MSSVTLPHAEVSPDRAPSSLTGPEERARLAREIHDGLAQELWLAKLMASKLALHPTLDADGRALCAEVLRSIDAALSEARTAVTAMRADKDPATSLSALLERQVDEFSDRFGIRADCELEDGPPIPSRVSVEVVRVLQEALNNVRKHARARRVVVRLERSRAIMLTVRDDGVGFDASVTDTGYGRQSMQERAESIGARLMIVSVPGRGTTVTLRLPNARLATPR